MFAARLLFVELDAASAVLFKKQRRAIDIVFYALAAIEKQRFCKKCALMHVVCQRLRFELSRAQDVLLGPASNRQVQSRRLDRVAAPLARQERDRCLHDGTRVERGCCVGQLVFVNGPGDEVSQLFWRREAAAEVACCQRWTSITNFAC